MKLSVAFHPLTLIVGVLSVAILSGSSSEFTTATPSSTTVTSREQQQQQQEAPKSLRRGLQSGSFSEDGDDDDDDDDAAATGATISPTSNETNSLDVEEDDDGLLSSGNYSDDESAGNYSSTREEEEEEITTLQGKKIITGYFDLAPPVIAGMNYIIALSGSVVGPRLNATVVPPSADWLLLKPDGIFALDVKLLLKTDDGEYIHQTITGRSVRDPKNPSSSNLRVLALFETSSDKYKWLGHTALFGIGTKEGNKITVDYYDTLL